MQKIVDMRTELNVLWLSKLLYKVKNATLQIYIYILLFTSKIVIVLFHQMICKEKFSLKIVMFCPKISNIYKFIVEC